MIKFDYIILSLVVKGMCITKEKDTNVLVPNSMRVGVPKSPERTSLVYHVLKYFYTFVFL